MVDSFNEISCVSKWRASGQLPAFPRDAFFRQKIVEMDASCVARRRGRENQDKFVAGVSVVLLMLYFAQGDQHAIFTEVCGLLPIREFAQEICGMNESGVPRLPERRNLRAFLGVVCVVLPIREWVFLCEGGEAVTAPGAAKAIACRSGSQWRAW